MKAENNLDSNLRGKSAIAYDFLAKIGFSKNFTSIFLKKKSFECNFFKDFLYNPQGYVFQLF